MAHLNPTNKYNCKFKYLNKHISTCVNLRFINKFPPPRSATSPLKVNSSNSPGHLHPTRLSSSKETSLSIIKC